MSREILLRELRNNASAVLREVEEGERLTITVSGRAVAELIPARRVFAPRAEVEAFLAGRRPDPTFRADVRSVLDDTTDDV